MTFFVCSIDISYDFLLPFWEGPWVLFLTSMEPLSPSVCSCCFAKIKASYIKSCTSSSSKEIGRSHKFPSCTRHFPIFTGIFPQMSTSSSLRPLDKVLAVAPAMGRWSPHSNRNRPPSEDCVWHDLTRWSTKATAESTKNKQSKASRYIAF